jgi:hypothetical protein
MNTRRLKKVIKRIALFTKNKYSLKYIANKVKHFYYKLTKSTKVVFPSTIICWNLQIVVILPVQRSVRI